MNPSEEQKSEHGPGARNGAAAEPLRRLVESIDRAPDAGRVKGLRGWFHNMVLGYLRHRYRDGRVSPSAAVRAAGQTETARAHAIIRQACIKSAATGAGAGLLSTGATLLTAETQGAGVLVAAPVAALSIGAEMFYRSFVHLEMTCDLADVFGVAFDPADPSDLWRLYGLAFRTHEHEDSSDPGKDLVHRITEAEEKDVGEEIGAKLLGESVLRNIVPVVGVAASAVTNWRLTERVGHTVRRYVRYRRALHDALAADEPLVARHLDLLIEGFWFLFTADGRLNQEETAVLSHYLRKLGAAAREAVVRRFTDEETDWLGRLHEIPEEDRPAFVHALTVAAAVDKSVSLPEEKILGKAFQALGRTFELRHVQEMVHRFETVGVMSQGDHEAHLEHHHVPAARPK